jgi:hypothetical protein
MLMLLISQGIDCTKESDYLVIGISFAGPARSKITQMLNMEGIPP